MLFTFRPMNEVDAHAIVAWHYEPPYDFYDIVQDPDDLAEFLDPQNWPESDYSVLDEQSQLVGFFSFRQQDGATLEIGLGLRPDLTGRGLGLAFMEAGLAFGGSKFAPERFALRVATFNARAIRVYERAGFKPLHTYMQPTNGGEYEFLRMSRPSSLQ